VKVKAERMFGGGDMRVINTTYYNDTLSITIPAFHPEETNKEMLMERFKCSFYDLRKAIYDEQKEYFDKRRERLSKMKISTSGTNCFRFECEDKIMILGAHYFRIDDKALNMLADEFEISAGQIQDQFEKIIIKSFRENINNEQS